MLSTYLQKNCCLRNRHGLVISWCRCPSLRGGEFLRLSAFLVPGDKDNFWKTDCSEGCYCITGHISFQESKSLGFSASRLWVIWGCPDTRILPFVWQPENRNWKIQYNPSIKHLAIPEVKLCCVAIFLSKTWQIYILDSVFGMITFRMLHSPEAIITSSVLRNACHGMGCWLIVIIRGMRLSGHPTKGAQEIRVRGILALLSIRHSPPSLFF